MPQAIRPHIGLAATNIDKAISFYRALFGIEPSKVKPGYAKFEVPTPALNLSVNAVNKDSVPERDSVFHMGIEVATSEDVDTWKARVRENGLTVELEENDVTCCYAVQNKFWVRDPDGNRWEVFMVAADAETHSGDKDTKQGDAEPPCCEPTCCT